MQKLVMGVKNRQTVEMATELLMTRTPLVFVCYCKINITCECVCVCLEATRRNLAIYLYSNTLILSFILDARKLAHSMVLNMSNPLFAR